MRLCADCRERFERNVFRVLDCKNEGCRKVVARVVKDLPLSVPSKDYFDKVQAALKSISIPFEVSPHLVRGLDYYTHTVFEITAQGLGSQDAVGAGGRYNGLIHELGGSEKIDYGAIGFALGMERILLASGQTAAAAGGIGCLCHCDEGRISAAGVFIIAAIAEKSRYQCRYEFCRWVHESSNGACE